MYKILINDNIFNKNLTLKQIASFLKRYCDMYLLFQLSDQQFAAIILYFRSLKSTFFQHDGSLNPTISNILGKKAFFYYFASSRKILCLIRRYIYYDFS
jgi:hypothetical protein